MNVGVVVITHNRRAEALEAVAHLVPSRHGAA